MDLRNLNNMIDAQFLKSQVRAFPFASLVRQAKLDVSYQLKGTDHGNYSFAM